MAEPNSTEMSAARDGWVRVQVMKDSMEAYLFIEPPWGGGNWPTKEDALKALNSEKIVFGLLEAEIDQAIVLKETRPVLVARGKEPVPGVDAVFKFYFKTGLESAERKYRENNQGRIDFRDIQTVESVTAGTVIAEKIRATEGEPGINVCGQPVSPAPGKDSQIKLGRNVAWDRDNLKIIAGIAGEPTLTGMMINVYPVHEVAGDVNFKTGNLLFVGNIVITGNVDGGFRVEAEGDVTIYGVIEAAEVRAGGNLTIYGGVSGMDKSVISCAGNLSAKYIEHAAVNCAGDIFVKEGIMYCRVNAAQKVTVEGGKGLIVGGVVRAGEEISAKIIGSRFGTATELEVGVKPEVKTEFQELEVMIREHKLNLEKTEKALESLDKLSNLSQERRSLFQSLANTSYALKNEITQAETRKKALFEEMTVLTREKARIRVWDTIFPGVRVSIGKAATVIRDELRDVVLYNNKGDIQYQSG